MLYFIRRCPDCDSSKTEHKNALRRLAYGTLLDAMREKRVCENKLPEFAFNEYGKPFFKDFSDIHFNISHCRGMAVCGVCDLEMGVDVEEIRRYSPRVLKRSFSEREAHLVISSRNPDEMFFRLWTLKESFVKALGIGISYPLNKAEFLLENGELKSFGSNGYSFRQILINSKHICSVCLKDGGTNSMLELENENEVFSTGI